MLSVKDTACMHRAAVRWYDEVGSDQHIGRLVLGQRWRGVVELNLCMVSMRLG